MRIKVLRDIATGQGTILAGRILTVPKLPADWSRYLERRHIEILPEDASERTVAPELPSVADRPGHSGRGRRGRRRATG